MLPGSYKSSIYTVAAGSPGSKKEVLWNVQQPGDSYDIKRSMIAKVPGEKSFMGDHLEFVCLFQAAQIQRLSDFLQSYKNRLKDIERINIDHHSYQIQIKQLFQRIADYDSVRGQNFKLKDFVKKQSTQIETLHQAIRSNQSIDENFKNVFEQYNHKIYILTQENLELKNAISSFNAKFEAFQKAKAYQIEEIKKGVFVNTKEQSDNSFNLFKVQVQSEVKKLQFDLRRLREQNALKDQQIMKMIKQREIRQNQSPKSKTKSENEIYLEQKLYQYESKISFFSQEIERLNIVIRDSSNKSQILRRTEDQYQKRIAHYQKLLKESDQKLKTCLSQMVNLNEIIRQLEAESHKKNQLQSYISQYESRIKDLNVQNQNLKSKLLLEINNSKITRDELEKITFENSRIKLLSKENSDLRDIYNESNQLKRHIVILQNQKAILSQQNERLTQLINNKQTEIVSIRSAFLEVQSIKNKLRQNEKSLSSRYQSQILRIKSQYDRKLEQISQIKGNQGQSKESLFQRQLQKYKQLFRSKNEECQKQKIAYFELQSRFSRLQSESLIKSKNYELSLANFKKQNQDFYLKTRQLAELQLKLFEFQNKSSYLQSEFQRLGAALHNRDQENSNLKRKIHELQSNTHKYELDASRKLGSYEQYISKLKAENEEIQKRLIQLSNQQNRKDLTLSVENKNKMELEVSNRQLIQQIQFMKQNVQRTHQENEQIRKRLIQSQTKYIKFFNQNSINFKNVQVQNQNFRRQSLDLKNIISNLEIEVSKREGKYEQNLNLLTKDNQELRKKLREIQAVVKQVSYELQNLNRNHIQKTEQLATTDRNYKNALAQIQNLRKYIKQYQMSLNNKFEGEISRNYIKYENTIQNINRQLEDSRHRYVDLQNKFIKQSQQYEKTAIMLKNYQIQIESLKKQINQKDNVVVNIESEVSRKIANYELNLSNLTRSNHDAQLKINQQESNLRQRTQDYIRLQANLKNMSQDHQNLKRRYKDLQISIGQKLEGEVAQRYVYYQQNIGKLTQDNDELRKRLNQLTNQLNRRIVEINNLSPLIAENQSLRKKIEKFEVSIAAYQIEVNRRFATYEQNIQTLSRENEEIKKKVQEISEVNRRISIQAEEKYNYLNKQLQKISFNLKNAEKENAQLRRRLVQTGELGRVVAELQSRVALTSQELERVNANLRTKCDEFNKSEVKIRNIMLDLETAKRNNVQQENRFKNVIQIQVPSKYNNYEQIIAQLRKKLNQYELRNQNLSVQLQRIGGNLKIKGQQSSQIYVNYKNLSNEYEELKRKTKQIEMTGSQNLSNIRRQNEDLRRKIQELEINFKQLGQENEKRFYENENRSKIMTQEIQRLNQVVKTKNQELERNRKQLREYQISLSQISESQARNKANAQGKISNLSRENEDLKRRLYQFSDVNKRAAQYQGNFKATSQQLEKVIGLLKSRNQQLAKAEQRSVLLNQDNQRLQQSLRNKTQQLGNLDGKLRQYINQIQNYKKQKVEVQKSVISKYEVEINKKTASFQQNISIINKEREDLYKKKVDYQMKIGLLTTEIQRLNVVVKNKNEDLQRSLMQAESLRQVSHKKLLASESELTTLQSKYKTISTDHQLARKHLIQYQTNIKRLHSQFDRLQVIIEQLKRERQALYQKNIFLSDEIERLLQENKDLQSQTKDVRLRLSDESSLQKRINEHLGLMSLRKRVVDKQKEVAHVRRASLSPHMMKH